MTNSLVLMPKTQAAKPFRNPEPSCTILKDGSTTFNAASEDIIDFQNRKHIELLMNPERSSIFVKFLEEATRTSRTITWINGRPRVKLPVAFAYSAEFEGNSIKVSPEKVNDDMFMINFSEFLYE